MGSYNYTISIGHLGEQLTLNQWVLGSSPRWCTKKALRKRKAFFIMIAALCECFRFAADFNPSQRLFLFCRRNARTFIVRETVAYMQLPIKVSSKIIS